MTTNSPATATANILTFHIPRTTDDRLLDRLAKKYKSLRLTGLKLSPEAFSSTLETEAQYPDDVWIARLANPQLETFVCAVVPPDYIYDTQDRIDIADDRLEWIAQATLRGPLEVSDFTLPAESGHAMIDHSLEHSQERWQFLALYTLPSFRGQGLAKKLCLATFDWLETDRLQGGRLSVQTVRVRTIIKRYNTASLALFRKLGFVDSGLCTLAEALFANGERVPEEWAQDDDRRCVRGGCVLSMIIGEQE